MPALLLLARRYDGRSVVAAGLLQATSLPFLVTARRSASRPGTMSAVTAAALVCAGLLSVVVFPAIALGLLRNATPRAETEQGNTRRTLAPS